MNRPAGALPDDLATALAQAGNRLDRFSRQPLWYPEVDSTNDVAARLAERGADEGVIVIADRQTAGRGRLGRSWASPPEAGLYVSIVLKPVPAVASLLTMAAGVAMADGIGAATGLQPRLKWPNDLQVDGRKLAGILAEATSGYVVLGVGINVLAAAYPPDVAIRATSIETELGRQVDRGLVLAECLAAFAVRYRELERDGGSGVIAAFRTRAAWSFGRRVEWDAGARVQTGVVENVDEEGALLVRTGHQRVRVRSGEVRWL